MKYFRKSLSTPAFALLACAALFPARLAAQPFISGWAGTYHEELDGADQPLPAAQVRRILLREGARMIGSPHLRGDEIIAIGRDSAGARKRFILDSLSGEVLDVTLIAPPQDGGWRGPPRERGEYGGPFDSGRPLPPPDHSLEDGSANFAPRGPGDPAIGENPPMRDPMAGETPRPQKHLSDTPYRAKPAVAAKPPTPVAPAAPTPAAAPPSAAATAAHTADDQSLSPIKPIHPPAAVQEGAPKVAPLPN